MKIAFKSATPLVVLMSFVTIVQAQNLLSQNVQTEFGIGISVPFLHNGIELNRSADLRNNALSYFANDNGERKNVGNYGKLTGWSVSIAYYRPVNKIKGLMLGSAFRTSLTGSHPEKGGYEEGFFFNFLSLGFAAKYYPFTQNNLFFKTDVGIASVFTKNRYLTEQNEQQFFHQFGIGTNASLATGYSFQPFKNKFKTIDLQLIYQFNSTRVEVNGIGNDQWTYSALTFMSSINF